MHFMQIAPDVLKILSDLLGFTLKNYVNFDKNVRITLRSDTFPRKKYYLYYGKGEFFYRDDEVVFDSTQHNELHIPDDREDAFGSAFIISEDPKRIERCVSVAPILGFDRPKNDITPGKQRVDYYQILVNIRESGVDITYRAYLLGPNGTPSYQHEDLKTICGIQWWDGRSSDCRALWNKMKD
ncbi:hypothetical protein MNO14_08130 [Luteimonas sp. S4-F44]|uniref:hypothetical protein n=1 Tax=Luteimonas sp. S4-F44 TaxID=2925842 RepID=UPI001F53B7B5|nr:hypothetical protein [Luteimonas sp. S4-F44]UNK44002.1 hypothetical protein MNO14_08130 [Luteimonas sp. S4-F44]